MVTSDDIGKMFTVRAGNTYFDDDDIPSVYNETAIGIGLLIQCIDANDVRYTEYSVGLYGDENEPFELTEYRFSSTESEIPTVRQNLINQGYTIEDISICFGFRHRTTTTPYTELRPALYSKDGTTGEVTHTILSINFFIESGQKYWDVLSPIGGPKVTYKTGTLTSGSTTVTFTNLPTSGNNVIDFFTSTGINYTAISQSSGSVTLTFDAQSTDVTVTCRIEEVS
jgi:hypothetical protein